MTKKSCTKSFEKWLIRTNFLQWWKFTKKIDKRSGVFVLIKCIKISASVQFKVKKNQSPKTLFMCNQNFRYSRDSEESQLLTISVKTSSNTQILHLTLRWVLWYIFFLLDLYDAFAKNDGSLVLNLLCKSNIDFKKPIDEHGNTFLHSAAESIHGRMVEMVISYSSLPLDVNTKNLNGVTPLHVVNHEIKQILVLNSSEKVKPGFLCSLMRIFHELNETKVLSHSFHLQNQGILQTIKDQKGDPLKMNFDIFQIQK